MRMWTSDTRVTSALFSWDMLEHFLQSTQDVSLQNLLQVSMDGPSVNWAFYEKLQQKVKDECSCQILNIGSCGLHIVHGAFKHGCNATKWDIAAVMRSMHSLFNETPARREDYAKVTRSDLFGKSFCNTRWLRMCQLQNACWRCSQICAST